jgi:hypothetical protein
MPCLTAKGTQERETTSMHACSVNKVWASHLVTAFTAGSLLLGVPAISNAAELKDETLKAWNGYVRSADSHMQQRLRAGNQFLWMDEAPDRIRQARAGEILVSAVGTHNPKRVSSGLIHHWIGAAFIPNAKLDGVFAVVRNYSRYEEFYRPAVIHSKPVTEAGTHDTFSMLLLNKAVVRRTALESDYESSYFQVDSKRWYSLAHATRVQEIEDYGQPGERKLPPNKGHGYIWRLYSISRFEERDGGVYIELEAIALSRDIPISFRWIVDPVVRRVSKDALSTSLRQTSDAVSSMGSTVYVTGGSSAVKRPSLDTAVTETARPGH